MSESTFYMPSPNILLYYTMDGARLLCTQCESILDAPKLKVTSQHNNYQNGYLWANKTDYLADINIPAFSSCKTLGQCPAIMRNITPWMETKDDLLSNGHPTVLCNENNLGLLSSYCYCRTGNGFIYPLTSGQNPMDMDPTQLTFDDIFFLLDQGNQKALDYINQHKDVLQNTIQDYFRSINQSWKDDTGKLGRKLDNPELSQLASDYLDTSMKIAQNRVNGKENIIPIFNGRPENLSDFFDQLQSPDSAIDANTLFAIERLSPSNPMLANAAYSPDYYNPSLYTMDYLTQVKQKGGDIPDYPEISQKSILALATGKASQANDFTKMLPMVIAGLATIGLVAAPYLAPFLTTMTGYAVTTANSIIAQNPIVGNAIVGIFGGAAAAGLDSSIRNTKIVTDANGIPSFLWTDQKAVTADMIGGGIQGGIVGAGIGAISVIDQGYNNWLNAPNTIGGNSRLPLSFAPNEPFASSAFGQKPSTGPNTKTMKGVRGYVPKSNTSFKNPADPIRDILGSGKKSSPEEWDKIIQELKDSGVIVTEVPKNMVYGPDPTGGQPGRIKIDPDASLSALKHEYQHFLDDQANGFPGLGAYIRTPDKQINTEINAYTIEIEIAESLGLDDVVNQLKQNLNNEIEHINNPWGNLEN